MQILLVDDEPNTRDSLRTVLTQLGHKPILEAKNGEEALKILDSEKTKIRMIISDWEMPYMDGITLSDRLAERSNLDLIPFLLITSDLPASRLTEIKENHQRIDHSLSKPFRVKILDNAVKVAFGNRVTKRDAILWSGSQNPPAALAQSLSQNRGKIMFNHLVCDPENKDFSVVMIDIEGGQADPSTLTGLKKTPLGNSAAWIGLTREPQNIIPFRSLCHQFIKHEDLSSSHAWSDLLNGLHRKLKNGWEVELLLAEAKGLLQQKKPDQAKKVFEKVIELDLMSADAHTGLGDILIQQGDLQNAAQHEFRALKLNPCLPKPYLKLFEILPQVDPQKLDGLVQGARMYCPQNMDVLDAANKAGK